MAYLRNLTHEFLILAGAGLVESAHKLGEGKIIDRAYVDHRSLSLVAANARGQPLEVLLILRVPRQEIARWTQGKCPDLLELAPHAHALAGSPGGQGKHKEQPAGIFCRLRPLFSWDWFGRLFGHFQLAPVCA